MAVEYAYPVSTELQSILPEKIARLSENRVGLEIMPIRGVNAAVIEWIQRDNHYGLQQIRGYEGEPSRIKSLKGKKYRYTPGVYGEFATIGEQELTEKQGSVTGDFVVSVEQEVLDLQDWLTEREVERIEQIIWVLLTTGTFAIPQSRDDGTTVVMFTDSFDLNTLDTNISWNSRNTATPLEDFRSLPILARGQGVNFGQKSTAYMNQYTFNNLLGNTNAADLGGKKADFAKTIDSRDELNKLMLSQELPNIVIYDECYHDDTNTLTLFIPNNKVVVVGARVTGEKIGEYIKTINRYAGGQPASYSFIKDFTIGGTDGGVSNDTEVGKGIEVHQGHNGGPVIYHPNAIFVMDV